MADATPTPPATEPPAATPPATPTPPAGPPPTTGEPIRLPDDHPLVTAFAAQKAELAQFREAKRLEEEAGKTQAQKDADAMAALKAENDSLKADALRGAVAKAKSDPATGLVIDPDLLTGSTKEELEASADKLIAFRGGAPAPTPPVKGNLRTTGPVSQVQTTEETREDRRKRLSEGLKR